MKKTSVYLEDRQISKLRRLARRTERAPADLIREAIDALPEPDQDFAIFDSFDGDGTSVVALPKKERLKGFGER